MTVWERRDLPVLQALVSSDDEHLSHGFLHLTERGENSLGLDLTAGEVHDAILTLADAGYVEGDDVTYETGPGAMFTRLRVTGRGQQALGEWPFWLTAGRGASITAELVSPKLSGDARPGSQSLRNGATLRGNRRGTEGLRRQR